MNEEQKSHIADHFRNTQLGFVRIKKNLGIISLSDAKTEQMLRNIIATTPLTCIETIGKNHYFTCLDYKAVLTINRHTLTIITAKQINKSS